MIYDLVSTKQSDIRQLFWWPKYSVHKCKATGGGHFGYRYM